PAAHVSARAMHVAARLGVHDRGAGEELQRAVVVHGAVPDDAAMSVVGVLAQADVRPEEELGLRGLDRAEGPRNDSLRVVRLAAFGIFLCGDAEENETAHAK